VYTCQSSSRGKVMRTSTLALADLCAAQTCIFGGNKLDRLGREL
jgi:hypothetical protein